MSISVWVVIFSILLLVSSFIVYPALLFVSQLFFRQSKIATNSAPLPKSVSFILVVHNAENLIADKLTNILNLNFQGVQYEIIIYLDGCTDTTMASIESIHSNKIRIINEPQHLGKISGLNKAAAQATGEILIFTDADAILEKDVVAVMLEHFKDSQCGGVCGLRVIKEKQGKMRLAQNLYITFDSYIKKLESLLGNITSNDGKLYAVRRIFFRPISDAVTDDLFACLNITAQHYKFIFEPKAIAHISTPSRGNKHEILRRRRIVMSSLNGIFMQCKLLNPLNYGLFSVGLMLNKVFRRIFGVALLVLFVSSYFARDYMIVIEYLFYCQLGFYLLAVSYPLFLSAIKKPSLVVIVKLASICWYFCLGNYATTLGVIDFLSGKKVSKWVPQKQD